MSVFRFAHISDLHIPPLPGPSLTELANKRVLGYLSWNRKRKHMHKRDVLNALTQDIKAQNPDHICITGDLVNIATPAEIRQAGDWLENLGQTDQISLVPGNHDAYVKNGLQCALKTWSPWMSEAHSFPYIHHRPPCAFIGISSAVATAPFMASGKIGKAQLERLENMLLEMEKENLFRVVMIHHPPQTGVTGWRKGLHDAEPLRALLRRTGAEMVIHGHKHQPCEAMLEGPGGPVPVYGAGSASLFHETTGKSAHYHLFEIQTQDKQFRLSVHHRRYDAHKGDFTEAAREIYSIISA